MNRTNEFNGRLEALVGEDVANRIFTDVETTTRAEAEKYSLATKGTHYDNMLLGNVAGAILTYMEALPKGLLKEHIPVYESYIDGAYKQ